MAGILDTISLAGTLVLAIPAALAGLEFVLVQGKPTTGGFLLFLAVALVLIQQRLTTPSDVPGAIAKRVFGSVVKEPEPDPDAESVSDDE